MSKPYEICDCKDVEVLTPTPEAGAGQQATEPPRDPVPVRARYEVCRGCGLDWNVSRQTVINPRGYICPRCWSKQRRR